MKQYIKDLKVGDPVRGVFRATDSDVKAGPGWEYLLLTLRDRTGEIRAISRKPDAEMICKFESIDAESPFVYIVGTVDIYNGRMQIVFQELELIDHIAVDMADFVAVSRIPIECLNKHQAHLVGSIKCDWLRRLYDGLMSNEGHWNRFSTWPAAISHHHAYMHGLLEHSVEVATSVSMLCIARLPGDRPFNRDLAVAGALLHDIGKIEEYAYSDGVTTRTDIGHLFGHIVLGRDMVMSAIAQIDGFPESLARQLLHIILSHHAKLEWGSPVTPAFEEAALVAYADQMSAAAGKAREATEKANGEPWVRVEGGYWWTGRRTEDAP